MMGRYSLKLIILIFSCMISYPLNAQVGGIEHGEDGSITISPGAVDSAIPKYFVYEQIIKGINKNIKFYAQYENNDNQILYIYIGELYVENKNQYFKEIEQYIDFFSVNALLNNNTKCIDIFFTFKKEFKNLESDILTIQLCDGLVKDMYFNYYKINSDIYEAEIKPKL